MKRCADSIEDGVQGGIGIRVRAAKHQENSFCHADNYSGSCQIRHTALEGGGHGIDCHPVQLKNDGGYAGNKAHNKELGGNFGDVISCLRYTPR